MCGIAGLVRSGLLAGEADERTVAAMCALQAHRGPDDRGVERAGRAVLGSTRLSILDLSPAGHMPMADPSGRWLLAYNGEVYDFAALRVELEAKGRVFRSRTDTEVVLHALLEWGEAALERFTGMFAIALWDREREELLLARDRFGIKPLYWRRAGDAVLFASELKALLLTGEAPRLARHALLEWSLYQDVGGLTPDTLVEDAFAVLAGECVTLRKGEVVTRSWYSPPERVRQAEAERLATLGRDGVAAEVEQRLAVAVSDRLVSDVPVGTLLSGGLDSSLITALAAKEKPGLTAFHVSLADSPEHDESPWARRAAKALSVELVEHRLDGAGFRDGLASTIYHRDAPLTHPNSVAYAAISRVARERGVIVLLSGEGADELFGGYAWRYRRMLRLRRGRALLDRLPRRARKAIELVGYAQAGLPVTSHRFEELLPRTVARLDGGARADWLAECEEAYAFAPEADRPVLGAMLADLRDFLNPLLHRLDRTSMSASVEVRVPFLDHRLVETAMHLPLSLRLRGGSDKWLLKRVAEKHLPAALVERKKMGFPVPLEAWIAPLARADVFQDGFAASELGWSDRALAAELERWRESPLAFFGLLGLEVWGRLFLRRESLDDVRALLARGARA